MLDVHRREEAVADMLANGIGPCSASSALMARRCRVARLRRRRYGLRHAALPADASWRIVAPAAARGQQGIDQRCDRQFAIDVMAIATSSSKTWIA